MPQGPPSTVYAGKGFNDALTLVHDTYPLYIWKRHLRSALRQLLRLHNVCPRMPEWHALSMAIVTTLMTYQLCTNRVPELFPGAETTDMDAAIPRPSTTLGSDKSGLNCGTKDNTTSGTHA
jgi:hypothetical protein